jgi:phosphoglycerate kinase
MIESVHQATRHPRFVEQCGCVEFLWWLSFYLFTCHGCTHIGSSLVEDFMVDTAKQFLKQAKKNGKQLIVPVDAVCSSAFPSSPMDKKDTLTVDTVEGRDGIPDGYTGLDTEPKSVATFLDALHGVT